MQKDNGKLIKISIRILIWAYIFCSLFVLKDIKQIWHNNKEFLKTGAYPQTIEYNYINQCVKIKKMIDEGKIKPEKYYSVPNIIKFYHITGIRGKSTE
jgi:hypothetical protein